jgi:hypothetical protein
VNLRILLHDTRHSTSLLEHLGVKDLLPFRNTAADPPPLGVLMMFGGGLCSAEATLGKGGGQTRFAPVLGSDPARSSSPHQCFADWWRGPVLSDQEGNAFSRYDFVHAVANKDGVVHVDAKLGAAYQALTRGNSMRLIQEKGVSEDGWETVIGGVVGGRPLIYHLLEYGPEGMMEAGRTLVYRDLGLVPPTAGAALEAEAVRDALRDFHDPLALAAGPLGSGETTAARADSARRRLREAIEAEFSHTLPEQQLRATIEWGYFDADVGHEAAALKLNISRATYFRRLAEAVERVTIRLTGP